MSNGENSGFRPDQEFSLNLHKPANFAVCIPAYNELSLVPVFQSLARCNPIESATVIVVFNAADNADHLTKEININAFTELKNYLRLNEPWFGVQAMLFNHLPAQKSGVGLARKLAMDKACELIGPVSKAKILACLDADCTVAQNYFEVIAEYFETNKNIRAASIYFEHPEPDDPNLKKYIVAYELHLRYLKNALQWCGYPWCFHTVGSSMAVRAEVYSANGGMNTRQAGEDFYFLHKLMPLGYGEINDTTVFPEARYSNRVPFGTGRSMLELAESEQELLTYSFASFDVLRHFFSALDVHRGLDGWEFSSFLDPALQTYFVQERLTDVWHECVANTSSPVAALKRFYKWFSGFRIIHCLHFLRDNGFAQGSVQVEAGKLAAALGLHEPMDLLQYFRKTDKTNNPACAGSC